LGIDALTDQDKSKFREGKMNIAQSSLRALNDLELKKMDARRDYRNEQIERRRQINIYEGKCEKCAQLFNEVFGPAVISHVYTLVATHRFREAWTRLND